MLLVLLGGAPGLGKSSPTLSQPGVDTVIITWVFQDQELRDVVSGLDPRVARPSPCS